MEKKIIRAIDPGPVRSAYVDWDGEQIHNYGIIENIYHHTLELCDIEMVFFEMIASYGMAVGQDVFRTCVWIGRLEEFYLQAGCKCQEVFRKDVKMHICGTNRAKDGNIITAVVDRFDPNREYGQHGKGTKANPGMFYGFSKDVWQAFALALYAKDMFGNDKQEGGCQ